MPLVVLPAHMCDIDAVFDVYFKAFEHEPVLGFLFPGGVDRKAHAEATKQFWSVDPNGYHIKCVDTDTGEIIGMASWEIYWKPDEQSVWHNPGGAFWLQGEDRARADSVLVPLFDMHEKLFGKHRHVYLPTMAVYPAHQRRGAGRLMMEFGMDLAEKMNLPIYLEATDPGYPLYKAMGFEKLSHAQVIHKAEIAGTKDDVEVPLMVKMPSKANGMAFKEWVDKGYPETFE